MNFFRHIRTSLLLVLSLFPDYSGYASVIKTPDENTLINFFFNSLYNFSFHEADSIVEVMDNSDMDRITLLNIKANLAWWKLLSGDAIAANLESCDSCLHQSLRSGLKNKRKDIGSLLNIIFSYSLKARLENYKGNTLNSFFYFYKSITYIDKCIDLQVNDEKLNLVLGLYFYFISYIGKEYFIIKAMFFSFPRGDKNTGIKYLEECSVSENEMIKTEANYFLMKIYAYTEKDYLKAYKKVKNLTEQHPENLVYNVEQLKILLKMKKKDEAIEFQRVLIEKISSSKNINCNQKNHFLSQIGDLTRSRTK